ncbi:MAG: hypothetical protein Harvfovirus8_23 [Harvfovirus sp.]|uniref:Uncharacterized protein n=1 Tax=Harvfovirus sp. TaxID=2487768 RepID=A0A3G5A0Z8_9VIRU|nr:MAG: hypothetical protein Harvfovirus8_23 [Harvfovirus sp.]
MQTNNLLQYHVNTSIFDSDIYIAKSERKVTRSLAPRLKGMQGRIRQNLLGKRLAEKVDPKISSSQ